MKIAAAFLILILLTHACPCLAHSDWEEDAVRDFQMQNSPQFRLMKLENEIFGEPGQGGLASRIAILERKLFGKTQQSLDFSARISGLEDKLHGTARVPQTQPAVPSQPDPDRDAQIQQLLASAVSAYDNKNLEKAKELFLDVLKLDANCADANFSLAGIYEDEHNLTSAEKYYELAYQAKPDDQEIRCALSQVRSKLGKQNSNDDGKELTPEQQAELKTRATFAFKQGDYGTA